MKLNIGLYIGDICSAPADVICVSTNPHLELMAGTGGAVRDQGGWEIQEECNAIMERVFHESGCRWLPTGAAVRTRAGRLPYQGIVMCVAIDAFHDSSEEIIADCTRNALRVIKEEIPEARSVAIPVFASGNGLFDFGSSLRAMLGTLQKEQSGKIESCLIIVREEHQHQIAKGMMQ